jgi:hypothetical protein
LKCPDASGFENGYSVIEWREMGRIAIGRRFDGVASEWISAVNSGRTGQSKINANLETALATLSLEKAWNFGDDAGGYAAL